MRLHRHDLDERGASLAEFAIIVPILVLLIFGAIDFGWAFGQHLDVKSGSREGARLAVVNRGFSSNVPSTATDELITTIRQRTTDLTDADTQVSIGIQGSGDRGDNVAVCIRYPLKSISGVLSPFLHGYLSARTIMRLESKAAFAAGSSINWTGGTCSTT